MHSKRSVEGQSLNLADWILKWSHLSHTCTVSGAVLLHWQNMSQCCVSCILFIMLKSKPRSASSALCVQMRENRAASALKDMHGVTVQPNTSQI